MFLHDLADCYIVAQNQHRAIGRELSARTSSHLRECARVYSRWLGHDATLDDLQPDLVNAFLASLLALGKSPYTVKNRRTGLRVLWRFAQRMGLDCQPFDGVRPVYCPELDICGYNTADARQLYEYARTLRGTMRMSKVAKSLWWCSLLSTKWDFGLRAGDMLRIRGEHFDPDPALLWVRENKTGKNGWRVLRAETRDAIAECLACDPGRELIWGGVFGVMSFYRAFKRLARQAGLQGTSRWLRRGASSEVDQQHPGSGWRFLRHSTPAVWEKHYRVERIVEAEPLRPPPLQGDRPGD